MYDDDRDALAAEYVLGTLSADERDQAEALLAIDPAFAEIVHVWERRLGELNVMVEAVEPPAEAWDKIKAEIAGGEGATGERATEVESVLPAIEEAVTQMQAEPAAEATEAAGTSPAEEALPEVASEPVPSVPDETPEEAREEDDSAAVAALASSLVADGAGGPAEGEAAPAAADVAAPPGKRERAAGERGADVVYLTRKTKRWQGITGLMTAIAALLAIYVGVDRVAPNLLPQGRQAPPPAVATAQPPASRLVAVLQQEPTAPAFLLTVDPKGRTLTVRRITGAPDSGRSYELWLIAGNAAPQSLGLVGDQEFTTRPLPTSLNASAMRGASYAVSLEPAGGAPHGAPTGPVLFTGKMVESVPGSS